MRKSSAELPASPDGTNGPTHGFSCRVGDRHSVSGRDPESLTAAGAPRSGADRATAVPKNRGKDQARGVVP